MTIEDLLKLEEQNHDGQIQFYIADRYYELSNYDKAFEWAKKSADQNCPDGIARLGLCYIHGRGCDENEEQGFALVKEAAQKGSPCGQNGLGWMYENGCGVEKNKAKACKWYRKAAAQDHAEAQRNLWRMYPKEWTPEEILECIRIRNGDGKKWVLRLVKDGNTDDMNYALEEFGERVEASFDTKESALRYFLDNKLYENVYRKLELYYANEIRCCYDEDDEESGEDEEKPSVSELRGFCGEDDERRATFYYVLCSVDSAEAKDDDAEAIKASGVDFSKAEKDAAGELWSEQRDFYED